MRLDPDNAADQALLSRSPEGRKLLEGLGKTKPEPKAEGLGTGKRYGNKKTIVFGIEFDSVKESRRYMVLRAREAEGKISGLETHKVYELSVNDQLICRYEADFVYMVGEAQVVEDVKSMITRKKESYRLKRKLMRACRGIELVEVEDVNA